MDGNDGDDDDENNNIDNNNKHYEEEKKSKGRKAIQEWIEAYNLKTIPMILCDVIDHALLHASSIGYRGNIMEIAIIMQEWAEDVQVMNEMVFEECERWRIMREEVLASYQKEITITYDDLDW